MAEYPSRGDGQREVLVLAGSDSDGSLWEVLAGWSADRQRLATTVRWGRTPEALTTVGAFVGPPLYPDEAANVWSGRSDHTPTFVAARLRGDVISAAADLGDGELHPLAITAVVLEFGVRFAAARLPDAAYDRRVTLALAW